MQELNYVQLSLDLDEKQKDESLSSLEGRVPQCDDHLEYR